MRKLLIVASLPLALLASPSAKADPFKGAYVGGQLGWGQLELRDKGSPLIKGTPQELKASGKETMIPFGLHGGMSSSSTGDFYVAGEVGMAFFIKNKVKLYAPYIGARLGYRVHERAVAYATIGPSVGIISADNKNKSSKSGTEIGVRPGAGVMFAINDKMLAGVQYNYTRYQKLDYNVTINGTPAKAKYRPEVHAVTARISYVMK